MILWISARYFSLCLLCVRSKDWDIWQIPILCSSGQKWTFEVCLDHEMSWLGCFLFFFSKMMSLPLFPFLVLPLLWRLWPSSLQVPFRENCAIYRYRFVECTVGGKLRNLPMLPTSHYHVIWRKKNVSLVTPHWGLLRAELCPIYLIFKTQMHY